MKHIACSVVLLAVGSGYNESGQTVVLRVLQTNDGHVRAVSLPSLHNGVYCGYGLRQNFSDVIYAGRLSDPFGTAPAIIASAGDPVPNRPGTFFGTLRIPTVWNETVYFSGSVVYTCCA